MFVKRSFDLFLASGLVAAALAFVPSVPVAAAHGDSPLTGTIFVDFDRDGRMDSGEVIPSTDALFPADGLSVAATDPVGASAACVVTGNTYSCDTTSLGAGPFRVQFDLTAADTARGFEPTMIGPDSRSNVQVVTAGTIAHFGVVPPSECPTVGAGNDELGKVWTTCYVFGNTADTTAAIDTVVAHNFFFEPRQPETHPPNDRDYNSANGTVGDPVNNSGVEMLRAKAETGAVYGLGYDEWRSTLFTAAYVKRHSPLGPLGLGGLYMTQYPANTLQTVDLETLGGSSFGTPFGVRDADTALPLEAHYDLEAFGAVGRRGIGDIELTPSGRNLLVSNLNSRSVMAYDVSDTANVTYSGELAFTNAMIGCPNNSGSANPDDWQIFAIAIEDAASALVGAVCHATTSQDRRDLDAVILRVGIDPATGVPVGPVADLMHIPLDYNRGCASRSTCANGGDAFFKPWMDTLDRSKIFGDPKDGVYRFGHPTPIFSDINIEPNGALTLNIGDRSGDQYGFDNYWPDTSTTELVEYQAGGELLKVCNVSGDKHTPVYALEGAAGCDQQNFPSTSTEFRSPDYHPSVGGNFEWYGDENWRDFHWETTSHGSWAHSALEEVAVASFDPYYNETGGIVWFDTDNGAEQRSLTFYSRAAAGTAGKANSIGDVEGCFIPMEIGDYVWLDFDRDGIQDPGEAPLAGVGVTLRDATGIVATTTTNANGQYSFGSADGVRATTAYTINFDVSSNTTPLPGGYTNADLTETVANAGDDRFDSDVSGGQISITTGAPGDNNHTFDAGYNLPVINDLSLIKTLTAGPDFSVSPPTASFTVSVTNQGTEAITAIEVTDYIPTGLTLAAAPTDAALPAGTTRSGNEFTIAGPLAAAATTSFVVHVEVTALNNTSFVNAAEISAMADTGGVAVADIDSTPDGTNSDAVIDHDELRYDPDGDGNVNEATPGDEDDHDIATLGWHDLTLIKTRATGQPYQLDRAATPPTALFDITVKNQGTLPALAIGITDYLPAGMAMAPAGDQPAMPTTAADGTPLSVTAAGDGTFTINQLDPGDQVTFGIRLNVTDTTVASFVNGAEITSFTDAAGAAATDIDSTPDATNDEFNAADTANDDVIDNPADSDDPLNSHNNIDYDPDGDGNVNEANPGDEDDHDTEVVRLGDPYDLALIKTVDVGQPSLVNGTQVGDLITFNLNVVNQATPVQTIELVDYLQPGLQFVAANNPATSATDDGDGDVFTVSWDATGPVPRATMAAQNPTGTLGNGERLVIPVVLVVSAAWDGSNLLNWAEISNFDNDRDPLNGDAQGAGTGVQLADLDSTPDAVFADDNKPTGPRAPGDDAVTGNAKANPADDEDDHDVAGVRVFDLALVKTRTPGQPFTLAALPAIADFDIEVKNQGPTAAFNINVLDHLPAGASFNSLVGVTAGTATVTESAANPSQRQFEIDTLAPGESVTFTIRLNLTSTTTGRFVNTAEISSFDDDAVGTNVLPADVVDIDSVPDSDPSNDPIRQTAGINADDPTNSHNTIDVDRTGAGVPIDTTSNAVPAAERDEDDHDSEVVVFPFDLALSKTIDFAQAAITDGVAVGDRIRFDVAITNQGAPVREVQLTDYVQTNLGFDAAANPDRTVTDSGDGDTFTLTWNPAGPTATLTGDSLDTGETVVVPVFLTVSPTWTGQSFSNVAEISNFDSDPTVPGDGADGTLVDRDSTPDAIDASSAGETIGGNLVDDSTTGDVKANPADDEDDHDIALFPVFDFELVKTFRGVDFSVWPRHATFDIIVTNQGAENAYNVSVHDHIPAGLVYDATATQALWTAEGVTGITPSSPSFVIDGELAAGAAKTFPLVFDIADLSAAQYVNAAEVAGFDADADPLNPPFPGAIDIDSTLDATPGDPSIDQTTAGYDPDGDGFLNEATPGDEDDHDVAAVVLPYDLALRKVTDFTDPDLLDGLKNGDEVTFFVEVVNQGRPVEDFDVQEYVSAAWIFDPALNPDGTSAALAGTSRQALPYTWDTTDPSRPLARFRGRLETNASVVLPVTLTVDLELTADELVNRAEIARFDNDGDPTNGDSDPANPNNPGGVPLIDVDSIPDAIVANDPTSNDRIDENAATGDLNADGIVDEDDADLAVTKWWDLSLIKTRSTGQPFVLTPGGPVNVTFDVTVKNQSLNEAINIGVVDTPPAGLTYASITDPTNKATEIAANQFRIDSLAPGAEHTFTVTYTADVNTMAVPAVNTVEISSMQANWDPDGLNGPIPAGVYAVEDIDSTPDTDPSNDTIRQNGMVHPSDSHNDVDHDAENDGLHDRDGIDEDDHDTEVVVFPYDLALSKTYVSATQPLVRDGTVTMHITVTNQGPPVEHISVVDYLDPAQWGPLDPALNADGAVLGSSTAAAAFGFSWDNTDPQNPVATLAPTTAGQRLLFGESLTFPITASVSASLDTSKPLVNVAEISNFDNDPATPGDAASSALPDRDSTPDTNRANGSSETIGGDLVDDAITGNGQPGNDEDDHDPVVIPLLDLALRKTLDPTTSFPVATGANVTFLIEIINQGTVDVTGPQIIDTIDPALWAGFDPALNQTGITTGTALPYTWTAAGTNAAATVTGSLAPGETATLPITLTVAPGADLTALRNQAEISVANATNADGTPATNPDGSPVLDADSTSDTDPADVVVDDVIDNAGGDEDDHDIAVVAPPTYNLGNHVWIDSNNNGVVDPAETGIGGVALSLFGDTDGNGIADDTNNDGKVDNADAIAGTTTAADGSYLFIGLATGDYLVAIDPGNWSPDGPLSGYLSSDPPSTDPDDDRDLTDDGTPGEGGYVWAQPVTLANTEPATEPGINNDPNHPDTLSNLTVDFGFWQPTFDLALTKTAAATNVQTGDTATYTITVTNQGETSAGDIRIIDYLPTGLTLQDPTWAETTAGAVRTITGPIAPGGSQSVTIATRVDGVAALTNAAEIAAATAIRPDGTAYAQPNGTPLPDIDSTPDQTNADSSGEDDHDTATLQVSEDTTAATQPLAFTGSATSWMVLVAVLLTMSGVALVVLQRTATPQVAVGGRPRVGGPMPSIPSDRRNPLRSRPRMRPGAWKARDADAGADADVDADAGAEEAGKDDSSDGNPPVDLNTATPEQLQQLRGVGPAIAARIVAYRTDTGAFESNDALLAVTGIGPSRYADIAPHATV